MGFPQLAAASILLRRGTDAIQGLDDVSERTPCMILCLLAFLPQLITLTARNRRGAVLRGGDYERSVPRPIHATHRPFEYETMRIWPISTRVNKPECDDPSILDEIAAQEAIQSLSTANF
jgi:hypothetical protein